MEEIKNVIFDFGGVLVDWNPRYVYRQYFKNEDDMEYFLREICNDEWNLEQDRGRPFREAILVLQEKHPAYHDYIAKYDAEWSDMLKGEIAGTVDILNSLKDQYRIFGLTNWSAEKIEVAYNRFPFFEYFEGIVVSGIEKLVKPDHRIYQLLLKRFGIEASETIFVDDSLKNVDAARELGIQGIHFQDAHTLIYQLQKLGISF